MDETTSCCERCSERTMKPKKQFSQTSYTAILQFDFVDLFHSILGPLEPLGADCVNAFPWTRSKTYASCSVFECCPQGKSWDLIRRVFPVLQRWQQSYLVDPASSHMLVSKIKPCMSKYKHLYTVKLRTAHYISNNLFDGSLLHG